MNAGSTSRTGVTLAGGIGRFVAATDRSDIPADVVEYAKLLLLDTLVCTIGGNIVNPRHAALKDAALSVAAPGSSTVLVSGERVDPVAAALVNAEAGGVLAAGDNFFFSHAATVVFANALALTEATGGTGSDLLMAFALGLETCSLLNVMSPSNLPPADVGAAQRKETDHLRSAGGRLNYVAVGGAAAAARALGLDADRCAHALTIAATTSAPRVTPPRSRLSSVNYISYYTHAQASVMAALLAQRGFTGVRNVLEELLETTPTAELLQVDLEWAMGQVGTRWWLLDDGIKRYPSCRYIGGPLELFERIRDAQALQPDEIERVRVRLSPLAMNFGPIADAAETLDPASRDTALDVPFNAPYLIAMLAHRHTPGPEWFRPEHFADPSIVAFMGRVELELDAKAGPVLREKARQAEHHRVMESGATGIAIEAHGRTHEATCQYLDGDPWTAETRATAESVREKARRFTAPFLTPSRCDELVDLALAVDELDDVRELSHLAVPELALR